MTKQEHDRRSMKVQCPACRALPGERCLTPSGLPVSGVGSNCHMARNKLATLKGYS